MKIILDLCGGTGAWSKPYKDNEYEVINVTLPEYDVRTYEPPPNVYGILSAPPCTMFSFARTNARLPRNLPDGMELVIACLNIIWKCQYRIESDVQKKPPLKFWTLENPNGMLNWFLGKPTFKFHPYEFGDGYKKRTCLWGIFNLPQKLRQYKIKFDKKYDKLLMDDFKSIAEQNNWKDTKNRQMLRSITPSGFAQAFYEANQ